MLDFSFFDAQFAWKFFLNLAFILVLSFGLYRRKHLNNSFTFTFILFNLVVFFLTGLLQKAEISLGLTFGLFAIFGMLRYRTEAISNREMTYLLIAIALGMMFSVLETSIAQSTMAGGLLLLATLVLESSLLKEYHRRKVTYDRLDLVKPGKEEELKKDLEDRLGIKVKKIEMGRADLIRDTIELSVTIEPT